MFSGSIVAIITPFRNGKVDLGALKNLVSWQISEGTQGIVACGSTGESSLLTSEERQHVLRTCIERADGRIPIIAGCGAPSTHETISMVKEAQSLKAQGALVVTPYYVKPQPEGIFQHYAAINDACEIPIIVYNNPARTVIDMSVDLIARLSKLPTIVGLKDSNTDVTRATRLRPLVPNDFCLLSGDDPTVGAYLAHGGHGCISVTANIAPRLCREQIDAWTTHDMKRFEELRDQLMPLNVALGLETNPGPIKFAVSNLGHCANELRLPLIPVTNNTAQHVSEVMSHLGLTKESHSNGRAVG